MALSCKLPLLLLVSSLFIHGSLAEIVCEELPKEVCAFAVDSSGKRCSLETANTRDHGSNKIEYQCTTSEAVAESMAGHIESDQCVKACGVDRESVGISSDALLEWKFTSKLCSPPCYNSCPNIVDLYFNLASGEGAYLPDVCKKLRNNPRRAVLVELLNLGGGAAASSSVATEEPISGTPAPASTPAPM